MRAAPLPHWWYRAAAQKPATLIALLPCLVRSALMTLVHSFLYRLPRFPIHFPVEFEHIGARTSGHCLNLSHAGLLAQFLYPLAEGATGTLSLRPANRSFDLRASVSHTEGLRSGLHFLFADKQQEQIIRALIDIISRESAS